MMNLALNNNRFVYKRVESDAMEPVYKNGDMIIADTLNKTYHGGGIFMVNINSGCGTNIARLHASIIKNGIDIIKDNYPGEKDFLPIEHFDSFVIGKVVGHIHKEVIEG